MSEQARAADAAVIRAGAAFYFARTVSDLFKSGQTQCELAEWLALLWAVEIVRTPSEPGIDGREASPRPDRG